MRLIIDRSASVDFRPVSIQRYPEQDADMTSERMEDPARHFDDKRIPSGKVPPDLLNRLLNLPRRTSPAVLVGPGPGEDAAVLRMGKSLMAVTSDPITFSTPRPGYYAVHVNANDIAVMGGRPQFLTLTMILPPQATERQAARIMHEAIRAADALEIVLIGGHSEVSDAVRTPIVSVTMFGRLIGERPLRTGDGQPGDAIIQVNPMGIEGTSILASEHYPRLREKLDAALVDRAAGFLFDPGISVVAPARLAVEKLEVHAMHDPTEGGLATGLQEIAAASQTGLVVQEASLLSAEETILICRHLQFDPLGLISSGCLLFTLPADQAADAVQCMNAAGYRAAEIGRLTDTPGERVLFSNSGQRREMPVFLVDELAAR